MLNIVSGATVGINKEFIHTKLFYPGKHRHSKVIDAEVKKCLKTSYIKNVCSNKSLVLSPNFLVTKKQENKTNYIGSKEFNKCATYKYFKSEYFETTFQLITPEIYLGSHDIKRCLLVSVNSGDR